MLDLERHKNILRYLYDKKDWVKGKELAQVFGVSDRTIRADVISIKDAADCEIVLSSRSKGYCYNSEYNIDEFINYKNFYEPSDRLIYVTKKLILYKEGINIYDLAEEIFVSDSTINSDIFRLIKIVHDLKFEKLELKKHGEIIQLMGEEYDYNKLLASVIKFEKKYIQNEDLEKFFQGYDIDKIINIIIMNLEKFSFTSRYISISELTINILLILERAKFQRKVKVVGDADNIRQSREYKISKLIFNDVKTLTNLKIDDNEVINFSYSLWDISKLETEELVVNDVVISDEFIYGILVKILKEIKIEYCMDFTLDSDFIRDIALHTNMAMKRVCRRVRVFNPIKEQMISEHPFLFDVAIYLVKRINDLTGILLNEEEISFLVAHLGIAVDKAKNNSLIRKKINVLLVVLEGKATLKHIIKKINDTYGANTLNIYGISSPYDIEQIPNIPVQFDLFISTTRFSILNLKQDIIIRPQFSIVDEINLRELIDKKLMELRENNFDILFNRFFNKELFFGNITCNSKAEVINNICDILEHHGYINEDFRYSVHEREALISTSLNTRVALPHPTNAKSIRTGIAIAILEKSIDWGEKKVKTIFLFAINKEDRKNQKDVYDFIIKLVSKDSNIEELMKYKNFDDFRRFAKKIYMM